LHRICQNLNEQWYKKKLINFCQNVLFSGDLEVKDSLNKCQMCVPFLLRFASTIRIMWWYCYRSELQVPRMDLEDPWSCFHFKFHVKSHMQELLLSHLGCDLLWSLVLQKILTSTNTKIPTVHWVRHTSGLPSWHHHGFSTKEINFWKQISFAMKNISPVIIWAATWSNMAHSWGMFLQRTLYTNDAATYWETKPKQLSPRARKDHRARCKNKKCSNNIMFVFHACDLVEKMYVT
jgi:hypothetical protein